ncbi:MAG: DNA topoisomerase IV [Flavobacteriales bacterium]|nr:DNA topoisomerase IV [Flavobacteriales bacterium]
MDKEISNITHLSGMYQNWFLDYASYVILERSVPFEEDGLKPVQRRILHSLKDLDDGRFHKSANVIGHTMKFHPHGDASIRDALVNIAQKDLLLDLQGNWGNLLTGDNAAAPRYIEVKLSKFALEVAFNNKITKWLESYDGRNKEPESLPFKFPYLLYSGVEGIAVGLSTKILPHNFTELINESIKVLKGKKPKLFPDFHTGGLVDVTNYKDGVRGGKIRVRARISVVDKLTLVITEIPFTTTTTSLISSIVKANERGKIKIKHIEDNTSEKVEIVVSIPKGVSPDKTVDALYTFTDCEVSISPLCCVIKDKKPVFSSVSEILTSSTHRTVDLLKKELSIKLLEAEERWHFLNLEKIFIKNKIYRNIEECETWDDVILEIKKGIRPYLKDFKRDVTDEDIVKLTEIKIKRISKYDSLKSDKDIDYLETKIQEIQSNLNDIINYTISYFKKLKETYGLGKTRKTQIKTFDNIVASKVVATNHRLYVDREDGFVGISLRKDEFVSECSDIDDVLVVSRSGHMMIKKIDKKVFYQKDIIHVSVYKKGDTRSVFNCIYRDGSRGNCYIKRFAPKGLLRDKVYDITRGNKNSKILYLSHNNNGEAELVSLNLKNNQRLKKDKFDVDFALQPIRNKVSVGVIVSRHPVKKIEFKKEGSSTLAAMRIWFDDSVLRLNLDQRGEFLGEFEGDDKIVTVNSRGVLNCLSLKMSNRFEEDLLLIKKCDFSKPIVLIYYNKKKQSFYCKKFLVPDLSKSVSVIPDQDDCVLENISYFDNVNIRVTYKKEKGKDRVVDEMPTDNIPLTGYKSVGKKIVNSQKEKVNEVSFVEFEKENNLDKGSFQMKLDI